MNTINNYIERKFDEIYILNYSKLYISHTNTHAIDMENDDYLNLNRTFKEIKLQDSLAEDVDLLEEFRSWLGLEKSIGWHDIEKKYRVILLAEAGSGKTTEFMNRAFQLIGKKKYAFFLRLENLYSNFEEAFEIGTFEQFQKWLNSSLEGWIFLDSIDEARLRNSKEFERSIKKFGRIVKSALDRAHIFISGRPYAWRSASDKKTVNTYLPFYTSKNKSTSTLSLDQPSHSISTGTIDHSETKEISEPEFYSLDKLSHDNLKVFIQHYQIEEESFLYEIGRFDGFEHLKTPQDVIGVIRFWKSEKKLGTKLEHIEWSIDQKLIEPKQDYSDQLSIPINKITNGAQVIAIALSLCKENNIKIPDGKDNDRGLDLSRLLNDYDSAQLKSLSYRPLFVDGPYGTIRIYNREAKELLAAKWIGNRIKNGNRRTIENLFLTQCYDQKVTTLSMRPILYWLFSYDDQLSRKVLKKWPHLLFEGGDPSNLPLDVKVNCLTELCEQIANNQITFKLYHFESIRLFPTEEMANTVTLLIEQYNKDKNVLSLLINLSKWGKYQQSAKFLRKLVENPTTDSDLTSLSLDALKRIENNDGFLRVLESLTKSRSIIERRLLGYAIDLLEPNLQSLNWLFETFNKIEPKHRDAFDDIDYFLKKYINKLASFNEYLIQFIELSCKLLKTEPISDENRAQVSEEFSWLYPFALRSLKHLIEHRNSFCLDDLCFYLLSRDKYWCSEHRKLLNEISSLIKKWPELNDFCFWKSIEFNREKSPEREIILFSEAWSFSHFFSYDDNDFDRVIKMISNKPDIADKCVALSLAYWIYKDYLNSEVFHEQLLQIVNNTPKLEQFFEELESPS